VLAEIVEMWAGIVEMLAGIVEIVPKRFFGRKISCSQFQLVQLEKTYFANLNPTMFHMRWNIIFSLRLLS
jgi:hypothetical protein